MTESGLSAVRTQFRAAKPSTYAPTLFELRRRAAGNRRAFFRVESVARAVGRSVRTISRHLRAIEELPEVESLTRLHDRNTGLLTGYRLLFRRRPDVSALLVAVSSPYGEDEKRSTRESPERACARALLASIKAVDLAKLRRVRGAVLRELAKLAGFGHEIEAAVDVVLRERAWRWRRGGGSAPSASGDLAAEAHAGIAAW